MALAPGNRDTAIFVGIMMIILAVFFLGIDSLFGWVVRQLLSLA